MEEEGAGKGARVRTTLGSRRAADRRAVASAAAAHVLRPESGWQPPEVSPLVPRVLSQQAVIEEGRRRRAAITLWLSPAPTWYRMVRRASGAVHVLENAPATPPESSSLNSSNESNAYETLASACCCCSCGCCCSNAAAPLAAPLAAAAAPSRSSSTTIKRVTSASVSLPSLSPASSPGHTLEGRCASGPPLDMPPPLLQLRQRPGVLNVELFRAEGVPPAC